jgi:hypothetical protein
MDEMEMKVQLLIENEKYKDNYIALVALIDLALEGMKVFHERYNGDSRVMTGSAGAIGYAYRIFSDMRKGYDANRELLGMVPLPDNLYDGLQQILKETDSEEDLKALKKEVDEVTGYTDEDYKREHEEMEKFKKDVADTLRSQKSEDNVYPFPNTSGKLH